MHCKIYIDNLATFRVKFLYNFQRPKMTNFTSKKPKPLINSKPECYDFDWHLPTWNSANHFLFKIISTKQHQNKFQILCMGFFIFKPI